MIKKLIFLVSLVVILSACAPQPEEYLPGKGMGLGIGGDGMEGIMMRHHAQVPEAYSGLTNPVPSDEASLERGATTYIANCATCHGDGGMGDGPAGSALDPRPSAVAHTSQMMADDYLY